MFDSTTISQDKPVFNSDKENLKLADSIISALHKNSSLQQSFVTLYDAVEDEVGRLTRRWQLSRVIEDSQINNTVMDFLEDLSDSPDDNHFLARLLAITLRQPANMRQQIQYYSSRRLFTLLKKNATASSHEYLAFNSLVKKNLNKLADEKQLKKLSAGYWTAGSPTKSIAADTTSFSPAILARLPIQRTISASGRNVNRQVGQSIVLLLTSPEHVWYKFKTAAISSALFNLDPATSVLLSADCEVEWGPEQHKSAHEACEINTMAGCMIEQISLQLEAPDKVQVLMAGLAYCFIMCPDYFRCDDFSVNHYRILTSSKGETDRIHEFLNTEQFNDLFINKPGRSTVFNRIRSFKSLLESSLIDFPIEAQQAGIKSLVNLLVYQYSKVTGRVK